MDATIIEAPASTKNRTGQRDPEMRQVKKGNQYHFGMKLHIGVDAKTGLVHSFSTTSANVHDVTEAHRVLHGRESQVWGMLATSGCRSGRRTWGWVCNGRWRCSRASGGSWSRIVRRQSGKGSRRHTGQGGTPLPGREGAIRLRQEPAPESHRGVRYRGLAKNRERLALLLGLSNLKRAQGPWPVDPGASAPKSDAGPETRVLEWPNRPRATVNQPAASLSTSATIRKRPLL